MLPRKYLFPRVIEMNYQAGRRLGVNVYLLDGGKEFLLIDIGYLDAVDEIIELIRQMDFNLSTCKMVIATHADADHIDGLNAVVKNFKVAAAFVARAPTNDPEFVRFDASAHDAGVPLYVVGRGDRLRFGAVTVDVLWPPLAQGDADMPSGNNDSVVLRFSFGRRTFLLTGDAEAPAESALVRAGDDLACDVLKVAHHGSRTSSTQPFVNAARPALAIISVGQDSFYGHPHAEVLKRWRDSGALVLTTGERGTVTVSTDGEDLKAATFVWR
jgi:beta-lactamase superfamily II metal-dependent hydrolase